MSGPKLGPRPATKDRLRKKKELAGTLLWFFAAGLGWADASQAVPHQRMLRSSLG